MILVAMIAGRLMLGTGPFQTAREDQSEKAASTQIKDTGDSVNASKVISWKDAGDHYGERCTVEGTVTDTHNSGDACFLNFHPNYKEYFTAVIFERSFDMFPSNPESHYKDKKVWVSGRIKEYEGKPEIILESPEQIEIVGDGG